jgi:hypothetical protein
MSLLRHQIKQSSKLDWLPLINDAYLFHAKYNCNLCSKYKYQKWLSFEPLVHPLTPPLTSPLFSFVGVHLCVCGAGVDFASLFFFLLGGAGVVFASICLFILFYFCNGCFTPCFWCLSPFFPYSLVLVSTFVSPSPPFPIGHSS